MASASFKAKSRNCRQDVEENYRCMSAGGMPRNAPEPGLLGLRGGANAAPALLLPYLAIRDADGSLTMRAR